MESLSVFKMDNNIKPDYAGAYAKIYEKATPESGTGKYYKEGKPTAQQLKAREKYAKIKDLTNKGKHKEASALYKEGAKYDNTKSPDYAKKKAALAKKHGGYDKIKGHPQYEEKKSLTGFMDEGRIADAMRANLEKLKASDEKSQKNLEKFLKSTKKVRDDEKKAQDSA